MPAQFPASKNSFWPPERAIVSRSADCSDATSAFSFTPRETISPPTCKPRGSPSDLVQEVFLDAQKVFHQFRGTTEAELVAWLQGLLGHKRSNFIRAFRGSEKRRVGREQPQPTGSEVNQERNRELVSTSPGPDDEAAFHESVERCQQAIDKLPAEQRELIRMRLEGKLAYSAIGRRLGVSDEAVRKMVGRVLRAVGGAEETDPAA